MKCAGCGRPVTRDDHLVAVSGGRLLSGLSPWCADCFWPRSFGGRTKWFAAFEQRCTCSCPFVGGSMNLGGCRCNSDHVSGPCHAWAFNNMVEVFTAWMRRKPWEKGPLPVVRAYNVRGRCVWWRDDHHERVVTVM